MAWLQLLAIAREGAELRRAEESTPPVACPVDGEPLQPGPDGRPHCPWDGWRPC